MEADFKDPDNSYVRFVGEVDARFSGSTLKSKKLRLDVDKNRQLRHLYSEDDVRFSSTGDKPWHLNSARLEAIFAPGGALRQVIAKDKVRVRDATRRLNSQLFQLFFTPNKKTGKAELSQALAQKDVEVQYPDKKITASGEKLKWPVDGNYYELTGKPARFTQQNYALEGDTIKFDRATGHVSQPEGESPAKTSVTQPK
jgi:lipopolysaccharide export system protein LptA